MQKEKQLVPKLRFPEFQKSWNIITLGEICKIQTGSKDTQDKEENGLYPFYVRSNTIERINSYSFDEDAILTSGDGAGVGKIYHLVNGKFNLHQRVYALTNFKTDFSIEYTYHFFSEKFYKRVMRLSAKNSVDSVRRDMIFDMKIPHPKIEEQQKIANFLTAVDNQIQTLEKKKSLLEHYKKGVMQKIFKQELRFKDEDGNAFPDWEYKNGNLLFKSISDKNHNSDLPILAVTQDQGAIPRHLIDYNIGVTAKSVSSYKVVQVGDFIISLRSFQGGIEYSNYKGICSPAYIILKPIDEVDRTFYKYYLKTPNYIQELTRKLEGIRDGKMISFKYFSEIKLPYPSVKEQIKIANFLSAIDKNIALVNTKIEHTKSYKKGLLQQMFV